MQDNPNSRSILASISDKIQLLSTLIGRSRLMLFFLAFFHIFFVPIVVQAVLAYMMVYIVWDVFIDWMVHQGWFRDLQARDKFILLSLLYVGYTVTVVYELEPTLHLALYLGIAKPMLLLLLLAVSAVLILHYGTRDVDTNSQIVSLSWSGLNCHIMNLFFTLLYAILYIGDTYIKSQIYDYSTVIIIAVFTSMLMILYIYGEYHQHKLYAHKRTSPRNVFQKMRWARWLMIQAMTGLGTLALLSLIGWGSMTYSMLIVMVALSYTIGHVIDLLSRFGNPNNVDLPTRLTLILPYVLDVIMVVQLVLYTHMILIELHIRPVYMMPILLPLTLLALVYIQKEQDVCRERLEAADAQDPTLLAHILRFVCSILQSCCAPCVLCLPRSPAFNHRVQADPVSNNDTKQKVLVHDGKRSPNNHDDKEVTRSTLKG